MLGDQLPTKRLADAQVLGGLVACHAVCLALHELTGQRESFLLADESAALVLRRFDGPVAVRRLRQLLRARAVFTNADGDQLRPATRCKEGSFRRLQSALPPCGFLDCWIHIKHRSDDGEGQRGCRRRSCRSPARWSLVDSAQGGLRPAAVIAAAWPAVPAGWPLEGANPRT